MCIDWGVFWTAASAIATLLAVLVALGVALWEIKFKHIRKLKISAAHATIIPRGKNDDVKVLSIDIVNSGLNAITIKEIAITIKKCKYKAILTPDSWNYADFSLPCKLEAGQSVNIKLPYEHWQLQNGFVEMMRHLVDVDGQDVNNAHDRLINGLIIIVVTDSLGKKYFHNTKIKRKEVIPDKHVEPKFNH